MKRISIILGAYMIGIFCFPNDELRGQTNTFPSSGNVGIGTTSPTYPIELVTGSFWSAHIKGTSSFGTTLLMEASNTNAMYQIQALGSQYPARSGNFEIQNYNTGSVPLVITNGSNLFLAQDGGNVGIGTANPGAHLEVDTGNSSATNLAAKFLNPNTGNSSGAQILIGPYSDLYMSSISAKGWPGTTYAADLWLQPRLSSNALGAGIYISTGDEVGIGTQNPLTKLHVGGQGFFSNPSADVLGFNSSGNNYAEFYDPGLTGTNGGIAFGGASTVAGVPSSATMFWNINNGNVGIGTIAPDRNLVVDATSPVVKIAGNTTSDGDFADFVFYNKAGSASHSSVHTGLRAIRDGGNDQISLGFTVPAGNTDSPTEAMRLKWNGNLGVGTMAPSFKLDVVGYMRATSGVLFGSSGSAVGMRINSGIVTFDAGDIYPVGFNLQYGGASSSALYINSSGNVGIGTTTPGAKLDVAGNANVQGNLTASGNISATNVTATGTFSASAFTSSGTTTFAGPISSASGNLIVSSAGTSNNVLLNPNGGNVGIGTSSPGARLHIMGGGLGTAAGSTTSLLSLQNTNANGSFLNVFQTRNVSGSDWNSATTRIQQVTDVTPQGYIDFNPTGGTYGLAFGNQNNEYLRIQNGGNVGIGTTNPTQKLSVNGTIQAKEVLVQTGWSDYVFDPNYRLAPLSEVERQIKKQKHLPGMPSAQEVAEHGVKTGEMEAKLLAKIEELTLHQIEQEKTIQQLNAEVEEMRKK